jgi:hypothetical protein
MALSVLVFTATHSPLWTAAGPHPDAAAVAVQRTTARNAGRPIPRRAVMVADLPRATPAAPHAQQLRTGPAAVGIPMAADPVLRFPVPLYPMQDECHHVRELDAWTVPRLHEMHRVDDRFQSAARYRTN